MSRWPTWNSWDQEFEGTCLWDIIMDSNVRHPIVDIIRKNIYNLDGDDYEHIPTPKTSRHKPGK